MFCKYCGKAVASDSSFCNYCGKVLTGAAKENNINQNGYNNQNVNNAQYIQGNSSELPVKRTNKKAAIIISSIAAVFLVLAIVITIIVVIVVKDKNSLNTYERMAYLQCLDVKNKMKKVMKYPDSFRIYDEMYFLQHYDEYGDNDYTYFIFVYGGVDRYGDMTISEAIFKDGEYIMDYDEDFDEDDYYYYSDEEYDAMYDLLLYEDYIEYGETVGDESWKRIDINAKKIKKKMGLK